MVAINRKDGVLGYVTSADSQPLMENQDDPSRWAPSNGYGIRLCQCENVHANGEIGQRTSIHAV